MVGQKKARGEGIVRHRTTVPAGLLAAALLLAPSAASAAAEPVAPPPASAGYTLPIRDQDLAYVAAEIEVPTLDCDPALLASVPPESAVDPRIGVWVGWRDVTAGTAGAGLRAGLVGSCSGGRPHYLLAHMELRALSDTTGPGERLTTLVEQPLLEPGDRVDVVLHRRPDGRSGSYAASWSAVTNRTSERWSRRTSMPILPGPPPASRATECSVTLLDEASRGPVRPTTGTVRVNRCSAMTQEGGALRINDVAGGIRTSMPLDGSPSSRHQLDVQRDVVEAGTGRWTATPRWLPSESAPSAEGGRSFEVAYEILG
jgi:hypothetical protein